MSYNPEHAIAHLTATDPVMARIIHDVGPFAMREDTPNPFRALARAVIFQQLSGKAAGAIYARFLALFPDLETDAVPVARRSSPNWNPNVEPFPAPAAVLGCTDEELRGAGLSRQKAAAVRDLAHHFAEGLISHELLHEWDDESVIQHLIRVRGVGRWTAEMFLLFHMRRPDVLPVNDVGINRAIMHNYRLDAMPLPAQVLAIGAPWRPWASVACWYLWRSEDTTLLD